MKNRRPSDWIILILILTILLLLFRVALGLNAKAASFTGELPPSIALSVNP